MGNKNKSIFLEFKLIERFLSNEGVTAFNYLGLKCRLPIFIIDVNLGYFFVNFVVFFRSFNLPTTISSVTMIPFKARDHCHLNVNYSAVRLRITKTPFMQYIGTFQHILKDVKNAAMLFLRLIVNRYGLGLSYELLFIIIAQKAAKL